MSLEWCLSDSWACGQIGDPRSPAESGLFGVRRLRRPGDPMVAALPVRRDGGGPGRGDTRGHPVRPTRLRHDAAGRGVAESEPSKAPIQSCQGRGLWGWREVVLAVLPRKLPGCCRTAPGTRWPRLLRATTRPGPRLGTEFVGHRQLPVVRSLRVVESALDPVGAFLAIGTVLPGWLWGPWLLA